MIIDSHCHLNYEPMSLSLKETINRANKDGVKYLLTISTEDKSFDKILEIISNYKCVFGSYGIHPHEAKNHKFIKSNNIIKKISKLPIIVHTRNAEIETFKILKRYYLKKEFKILIHCFTGSKDFAFKLLDLGAYISASGVVTFKNSQNLANTFKIIPNERILVETDSPYLAPVPLRGKPNEPSFIIHTVQFLSKLKKISFDDFSNITSKNFFNLFGQLN